MWVNVSQKVRAGKFLRFIGSEDLQKLLHKFKSGTGPHPGLQTGHYACECPCDSKPEYIWVHGLKRRATCDKMEEHSGQCLGGPQRRRLHGNHVASPEEGLISASTVNCSTPPVPLRSRPRIDHHAHRRSRQSRSRCSAPSAHRYLLSLAY